MKLYLFLFSIFLLLLDQLSKFYIARYFYNETNVKLLPFLNIYYSENYGVAFSFLQSTNYLIIIASSLLIIILMFLFLQKSSDLTSKIGYTMIICGAIGNLIDRIRLGYVIDFISFHISNFFNFAIFNFADSFITIGVILIIIHELFYKKATCK